MRMFLKVTCWILLLAVIAAAIGLRSDGSRLPIMSTGAPALTTVDLKAAPTVVSVKVSGRDIDKGSFTNQTSCVVSLRLDSAQTGGELLVYADQTKIATVPQGSDPYT